MTSGGSSSPWPLPERIRLPWKVGATLLRIPTIFLSTTLFKWTQRIQAKNAQRLVDAVMKRPNGTSLLTVCNHLSYIDDPAFYHVLPLRSLLSERRVKWTPAAREICFNNRVMSGYFSRCHAVPVTRGGGVYQKGVDFLISKLNEGHWVHIYPEGKMNMTGENLRLKWGVGRIIAEAKKLPIVLPMWLVGIDDILPNSKPVLPKLFKKLTVYVGEPIDLSAVLQQYHNHRNDRILSSAVVLRKQITDVIQEKMRELRTRAEELHNRWNCSSRVAYRLL